MGVMEAAQSRREPVARQWSIPTRLTLAMAPVLVVALLLGVFLTWSLAASGQTTMAVTVGGAVGLVVGGSLLVAYRMGRSLGTRIGEITQAARRMSQKDLVELLI